MTTIKTATLERLSTNDEGTLGRLTLPPVGDGGTVQILRTIELPWRDLNNDGIGDPQKSCITPGRYLCKWQASPKYGWVYEITGVVGRSHILMHSANFAGDIEKGWQSQLLGCISPGRAHGVMLNDKAKAQKCVTDSRKALQALHQWGQKEQFTLTITAPEPTT